MPNLLALAEAVVIKRQELAAAEEAFNRAAGMATGASKPKGLGGASAPGQAPVSQRVRDVLRDGRKPLTFGELVTLMGGPATSMAVRSALKKGRERKEIAFKGGLYSWVAK